MSTETAAIGTAATGSAEGVITRTPGRSRQQPRGDCPNNICNTGSPELALAEVKFSGRCNELKDEVYDYSEQYSQVDSYTKMTKEVTEPHTALMQEHWSRL